MAEKDITRLATPRRAIPDESPEVGRLSAMVLALLGELTVTRERLDSVERLLESAGILRQSDIEAFDPQGAAAVEREKLRRRQIGKVMRPYRLDLEKALAEVQHKLAEADAVLEEEVTK
ncbi:MAG: hypothetical protein JJU27_07120 [Gammaproteobacteria bacterium]|nr:hypothetical protein [Gammaproteobacteria bacterium]